MKIRVEGVSAHVQWAAAAEGKLVGVAMLGRQSSIEAITANLNKGEAAILDDRIPLDNLGKKAYLQSATRLSGYLFSVIVPNTGIQLQEAKKGTKKTEQKPESAGGKSAILWHESAGSMLWRRIFDLTNAPLLDSWQEYVIAKLRDEIMLNRIRVTLGLRPEHGKRIVDADFHGDSDGWCGALVDIRSRDIEAIVLHGLKNKEIFA
jgi:hypothetical protein